MKTLPVHVLTGFLGAGKTTLLNRALKEPALANTAVIVNEFGDVALDHLLIETGGEEIIELANGCLCCTVRGDLAEALMRLAGSARGETIDRIVIETSGLADPLPVLQTIGALPPSGRGIVPGNVVAVVNTANDPRGLGDHPEAQSQIRLADRIVLTNADLAEGAENREAAIEAIRKINTLAPVIDAQGSDFNPLELFAESGPAVSERGSGQSGHHGHHTHSHSSALSILRDFAVTEAAIAGFCDLILSNPEYNVLRLKGIFEMQDNGDRPLVVQAAGSMLYPFERLDKWPDDARGVRLVIIGDGLDEGLVTRLFDAFCGQPSLDMPDREALTDNPLAVPGMKF